MENSSKYSSSFAKDVFGSKKSSPPSSSSDIFESIFPLPSVAAGTNHSGMEVTGAMHKKALGNQVWANKEGAPVNVSTHSEGASMNILNKERGSIFQGKVEPCPLSSSLYYGGQEDMYIHSSNSVTSGSHPVLKKDGKEDPNGNDSHSVARGNWWQGSLYY